MQRILHLIITLSVLVTTSFSQLQTLEVKEIQPKGAIPIFTDHPDDAAIIVYTSLSKLSLGSNMGVIDEKSDPKKGKYVLIVRATRQAIQIQSPGFMEASYKTPSLSPRQVLYLSVEQATGPEIPVVIMTEPADATVIVDGIDLGTGPNYKITAGNHEVTIRKTGYKMTTDKVNISADANVYSYKLREIEPVMVTLKTNPAGASIFIDDVIEGQTNKQLFKFPGEYNIRLILNKYETVDQTINVTETGNNTWTFNLVKTTAILTIDTAPSDAQIWINGELTTSKTLEVAPGQYRIEVKKDGWYSDSRTVIVKKGQDQKQSFLLEQMTGKLQLVVEPMETQVTMMQGSCQIDVWSGSKYKKDILIGQYTLVFSAAGYTDQSKTISIEEDKTTSLNVKMEKTATRADPDRTATTGNIEMIFVKGGTFTMGDIWGSGYLFAWPTHTVTLNGFYISKYEVTQKQYKEVLGYSKNWSSEDGIGDDNPAYYVIWYEAVQFCNKFSEVEGLEQCYTINGDNVTCDFSKKGYRLPTDAEWEYAARSGGRDDRKWSGTNSESDLGDYAWYDSNSGRKAHPVGTKQPNDLGIYDMSGNVNEWCWDWYSSYSSLSQTDPTGPSSGGNRVRRGGCWAADGYNCGAANRGFNDPRYSSQFFGFRLFRTAN